MKTEYLERREEEMSYDYPSYLDDKNFKPTIREVRELRMSDGSFGVHATLTRREDEPMWEVLFEDQYWNYIGETAIPASKPITDKDLWSVYTPIAIQASEFLK